MATSAELEALRLQEAKTMDVHTDLSDLVDHAVVVYNKATGEAIAFDADVLSGRARVVVGTEEEIDALPKVAGVFYCTFEDVT